MFILSLPVESLKNAKVKQDMEDARRTGEGKDVISSEKGRRRRRRKNELAQASKWHGSSSSSKVALDFGGSVHGIDPEGDWMRPEAVKMQVCEDDTTCRECTKQTACWHGYKTGKLQLDVPASSPDNRFVAEVWASCSDGNGKWYVYVWPNGLQNGVLNIYVNSELYETVTRSNKMVELPIVKDSRVRAEFVRTDNATKAFGYISMYAEGVDAYIDNCMGVKNCLVDLGDGTDAAFLFRNSNVKQLQCVSANTTAEQNTVSDHCSPWATCVAREPGRKDKLKILLKVGVGKDADKGELLAKTRMSSKPPWRPNQRSPRPAVRLWRPNRRPNQRRKDHPRCIDPAAEDAESWDCECMAEMTESCGGADEDCFRTIICRQRKVCWSWKRRNCDPSFSFIAKQNASIKESALLMRRDVEVDTTAGSRLDSALDGKCAI